ncbi:MAG: hypothetical protein AB7I50_10440 [Vicinamibacterales bacterium]
MRRNSERFRVWTVIAVACSALLTLPLTASATQDARDQWRHRHDDVRVHIGGDVTVAEGEHVREDAVAILGAVRVNGEVDGDVVAIGGDVLLGPHAIVRGDTTVVGGQIREEPGAQLLGGRHQVALNWDGEAFDRRAAWHRAVGWPSDRWWSGAAVGFTSVRLGLLVLLCLPVVLLGGGFLQRVRVRLTEAPLASTFLGVCGQLLLVPACGLLCAALIFSIVGIPLLALVPVLAFALAMVWIAGFAVVATWLGDRLLGRTAHDQLAVGSFLAGFAAITGLSWLARVAWWMGWLGGGSFALVAGLGLLIEAGAWAAALGALVLTWFPIDRTQQANPLPPPLEHATGSAGM